MKDSIVPNPGPRYNPFDPIGDPMGEPGNPGNAQEYRVINPVLIPGNSIPQTSKRQVPQSAIMNPRHILDIGAVKSYEGRPPIIIDPKDDECALQQNGIDLRLDEVQVADGATIFTLHKKSDQRCRYYKLEPDADNQFKLYPGKQYALDFMEWVEVPVGMAAYLFVRSSFNRYGGIFLTGLYDAGFRGRIGGIFRPYVPTFAEKGVRVAQIVFLSADSHKTYEGQYQDQIKQV